MRTTRRLVNACGLAVLALAAAVPARADDKLLGNITVEGERVSLTHGLGWTDGTTVVVGFYGGPLDAKDEARAMQGVGAIYGVFAAPNVTLHLSFKDGATKADLASFTGCHVGFYRFKAGLYDWNSSASSCGAVELSGDLKVGAVVHGKLKGQAEGFPEGWLRHKPVYAWDIDFTVTLRAGKP